MKKKIIFILLFLITGFLFINSLFKVRAGAPYIRPVYNTMNVILETKGGDNKDIILKANNEYLSVPLSKNLLNKTLTGKIDSLDILISDNYKNEIKSLVIFNDFKIDYYKDFSKFKKETVNLCPAGVCENYSKYEILKAEDGPHNFSGALNLISFVILSLFSGAAGFFLAYIFLFITLIYYINNFKTPKINPYLILGLIFTGAVILRLNGLFDYLPWADEYYSIEFSRPMSSILTLFKDPGNPPVFYILLRIWFGAFGVSLFSMKTLPFVLGILTVFSVWFFLKKTLGTKAALTGAFLASINVPLIYFSTECRSYIFQALLTPVLAYALFKILNSGAKPKHYVAYGALVALALNIHYYEFFLVAVNFLFGGAYLILGGQKKDFLKFLGANLIGGAFFLPFFLYTALNSALLNQSFNNWIPEINFNQILKCSSYLFGGIVSLLLSFGVFIKTIFDKKDISRLVILYSFFAIWAVIGFGVIFSYLIRPMLVERYLILLSPLFIIFLSAFFAQGKRKFWPVFCIIFVLIIQAGSFQKNNSRKGVIEGPMAFSHQFFEQNPKSEIYVILNTFLQSQTNLPTYHKKITYIPKTLSEVEGAIRGILDEGKNPVIFTSLLEANAKNSKTPDNYACFFNSATDMCIWKIEQFQK